MSQTKRTPIPPRVDGLLAREVDREVIVIDSGSDVAHLLTGLSADVWRAADTGEAPAAAASEVAFAVADLQGKGLLQYPGGMSRRDVLRRTGTLIAATSIASIALPQVAAHASTTTIVPITGTGTYTLPSGARNVTIIIKGAGGGTGGAGAAAGGGGGTISWAPTDAFIQANGLSFQYNVGTIGTAGGTQSAGAGGTGYDGAGAGGSCGSATAGGGGGGGGSTAIFNVNGNSNNIAIAGGGGGGGGGSQGTTGGGAGGNTLSSGLGATGSTGASSGGAGGTGGGQTGNNTAPANAAAVPTAPSSANGTAGTNKSGGGGGGGGGYIDGFGGTGATSNSSSGLGGGGGGGGKSYIYPSWSAGVAPTFSNPITPASAGQITVTYTS